MNRYASRGERGAIVADLRSDTVTRPTQAMREAMAKAPVGDDVYGDDPTVNALEAQAAALLGFEAGLFVASGTQSNLTALLTHCGRGDEYISAVGYHIPRYEAAGAAVLGGISPRHLTPDENGWLSPEQIAAAVEPDDPHFARSRLVTLENAHDGRVQSPVEVSRIAQVARSNGLSLHLDGARLMNAVVASGEDARTFCAPFDTVSLCLSKGLGAPVGSVLCGSAAFVRQARRNRKLLGGGMRQAGILAQCGLHALTHHVDRLADDHARARRLAEALSALGGLSVDMSRVETNMVWVEVAPELREGLVEHMRMHGIVVSQPGPSLRLVTHLDIDDAAIDRVIEAFRDWTP